MQPAGINIERGFLEAFDANGKYQDPRTTTNDKAKHPPHTSVGSRSLITFAPTDVHCPPPYDTDDKTGSVNSLILKGARRMRAKMRRPWEHPCSPSQLSRGRHTSYPSCIVAIGVWKAERREGPMGAAILERGLGVVALLPEGLKPGEDIQETAPVQQ